MSTLQTLMPTKSITEEKKKELDALTSQVLAAQNQVEELQAVVTSLAEKSTKVEAQLAARDANKTKALNNKELVDKVVDQVIDLEKSSKIIDKEIKSSCEKIGAVALDIKKVIDLLIYSAEEINYLSNLIVREKAKNPLISDELVTMVGNAGTNANNAVALTLVALDSVFTARANTTESDSAIILENFHAEKLYDFMTKEDPSNTHEDLPKTNIKTLIDTMYDNALELYALALDAKNDTTKQLSNATTALDSAKMNLSSLEAGLAAANAAALAS
ncbi:hypothetical protein GCM10011344_35310 [Dokdonia pacifica]|uniref:Uncharacterized protein n=1 Tax=Dokdonia pacifica TaxID=1627892 RepID=A0A239AQR3_9FLAO|nr:hypothetical protein [Dokdonia pacifica]GGG31326.1 hypothetical protein GCM10011344_35310 [Dokdonia pacifica]SNR98015.1 hypothetical protein SAMN06265376_10577 [Dokdonia pacifica]